MMTLIVGGAASGKSEYAERLAEEAFAKAGARGKLWYIATLSASDEESLARVEKHRARRADKGYETVECPNGAALSAFAEQLGDTAPIVLLDDFGNLAANELFAPGGGQDVSSLLATLQKLAERAELFCVSNNVFEDHRPGREDPDLDRYYQYLADLNTGAARAAGRVCEVTAGLAEDWKGGTRA
ncbi:MAG: bifunctional adenosylcobinamide kinase/adenosylcobinamide-phosphate guanylyltransferase [Clostridia bacterium]|nr:bifunctional adenosylcobinamide kinase/adenosylcobinamide-phosphate guanylyltransferase [Clostridia bacterium]